MVHYDGIFLSIANKASLGLDRSSSLVTEQLDRWLHRLADAELDRSAIRSWQRSLPELAGSDSAPAE